jgi:competence protein ComEA
MRIKKYFDSFFVLSKSERNGAMVLLAIVLVLIFSHFLIPSFYKSDKKIEFDYDQRIGQLEKIKDSLGKNISQPLSISSRAKSIDEIKRGNVKKDGNLISSPVSISRFDPNHVSFEELVQLGFSTYVAKNLLNYRGKGGVFHKREDLKKIYGVDSLFYQKIEPYIIIPDNNVGIKILLDINGADSAALTSLNGIGPVYASRICKYRKYLGGFVSIDQLKEVYQLPVETFMAIKNNLTVDANKVQKININFADVRELKKHPYCSYEIARKIIDYRSKKGYIQSVDYLLLDSILEVSAFNRLSPYLKVQ